MSMAGWNPDLAPSQPCCDLVLQHLQALSASQPHPSHPFLHDVADPECLGRRVGAGQAWY